MQCPGRSQESALWFPGHEEVLQLTPHSECKSWTTMMILNPALNLIRQREQCFLGSSQGSPRCVALLQPHQSSVQGHQQHGWGGYTFCTSTAHGLGQPQPLHLAQGHPPHAHMNQSGASPLTLLLLSPPKLRPSLWHLSRFREAALK